MIDKINYPEKHVGDKFTHVDANDIKNAINNNADVLSTVVESGGPSKFFSPLTGTEYTIINGTLIEI